MNLSQFLPQWGAVILSILLFAQPNEARAQCDSLDFQLLCEDGALVNDAIFACGFDCIFAGDLNACFSNCIATAIPTMSTGCVGCFAAQSTCAQDNCFFTCAFGSTADCEACILANCQSQFEDCAGIVDADGDGQDVICDCDDGDASVYPGAPGSASGLDNNCDGIISLEEILCALDLNGDFFVSVADVLLILADFGCLIGCGSDVTGDGAVTVSDVLELLGGFGEGC